MPKGQSEYNKCAEKASCKGLKIDMTNYHKCARTKMCKKKERNALKTIQTNFTKGQETRDRNKLIKTFKDAVKKDKRELKITKEEMPKYHKTKQYVTLHTQTLKKDMKEHLKKYQGNSKGYVNMVRLLLKKYQEI
jgi:hypothetical protein